MIDADDYEAGQDPASFITRSLTRLWTPEGIARFDYTYNIATVEGGLYFYISLDNGDYLDFTHAATVCDNVDEQLGPSLLTHLRLVTPLTPAFTPEVSLDFITTFYWDGSDDAENLLEMARSDLAYAQQVNEDSLSDEEVASYADSHYFTPKRVNALIDKRYQLQGTLPLEACLDRCRQHALPNLTRVCELLMKLWALSNQLPEPTRDFYAMNDSYQPFAVLLGLQREGADHDLVDEIYREHEQAAWEGGGFDPVYVLEVLPEDPYSLTALRGALEVGKRSLELTEKLYSTLEVTRCLFP